jgi:hypothetical protein
MAKIKLTDYGQQALNIALVNGNKPVIKKGTHSINLNNLTRVSDATVQAFLAPDNFNPYFEVVKNTPAKTSAKS